MRSCDVLVVGLGPAGSSAAAAAARAGCAVVALDKKKVVGLPVQCAEFIPLPLARYAHGDARAQPIAGMATFLPSGERAEQAFRGLMIRRDRFDQALARTAQACGALLWTDSALQALDANAGVALVSAAGGLRALGFRVVIAADGPSSQVATLVGLPRLPVANTRQYTVPLRKPHADTDIWLSARYPGGYAWLFPKGEVANLGLGMDPSFDRDLKAPLDELHAKLVAERRVGSDVLLRTGGPIPVGGMRARLDVHVGRTHVLFAGDAAGLTHPVTGAGIAAAVTSGERAGDAAAHWLSGAVGSLTAYEEELRELFGPSLERGLAARRRMAMIWSARLEGDAAHRPGWIAFDEYFHPNG